MKWISNDGGRAEAGYKGTTRDCVARAIAIATEQPYSEVYDALNENRLRQRRKSSARTGLYRLTYERYLLARGWKWIPTMRIGQGCKVHLSADELPSGRLIVAVSKHLVAVIDGVAHDTSDPCREGKRCVYGYYHKGAILHP